jgi:polar amino acid transport system substrate-binding protein
MKRILVVIALLAVATAGQAQQSPDPRVADIVSAERIRIGLFATQFVKDPSTGELKGAWSEVGRALAARIGVQLELREFPTPPEAIACLKSGACDVLFLPLDERAAMVGAFSSPIFQFDYTLLVPPASTIRTMADADQHGIRIAAVRNHASANELRRQIKQAELVYADTPDPTFELMRTGQTQAMASARNTLLTFSIRLPESRVLADRYGVLLNRMVVSKSKEAWLAYVTEFVEDVKASGVVQKAIDQAGPRGLTVPAPGDSK